MTGTLRQAGIAIALVAGALALAAAPTVRAQVPPSVAELAAYTGLHAAAATGDVPEIERLARGGSPLDGRDGYGRTPLHVAAHRGQRAAIAALARLGADPNALEADRYDMVTIAAVNDDVATVRAALAAGNRATNVTSRYDGTALIAAAHLGHYEVVQVLIDAGAPLDHVNNLGWTALIESIVLGDGGERHVRTLAALVRAGASVDLADRNGTRPLALARGRGYAQMVRILEAAGAR